MIECGDGNLVGRCLCLRDTGRSLGRSDDDDDDHDHEEDDDKDHAIDNSSGDDFDDDDFNNRVVTHCGQYVV